MALATPSCWTSFRERCVGILSRHRRMAPGLSRLYELQPDPYDVTQRRGLRVCLFREVTNAPALREELRSGAIDAALIKAELVLEPFVLLAAANRAVHQAAHNRLSTRSLAAELIYSLSPNRNISESLVTFGIGEKSQDLLVAIFDDERGDKLKKLKRKIEGRPAPMTELAQTANLKTIKKVYHLNESEANADNIVDSIVTRVVTKDYLS